MMVTKLNIGKKGSIVVNFGIYSFFLILVFCYGIQESWGQSLGNSPDTLIYGKLANGFEYYIKALPDEKDLKMDLFVKTGFNFQDSSQFEVPHLLEHMMFRSTKNFPSGMNQADSLIKQYGMQGVGRDVYAFTTYKTTNYTFNPNPECIESVDLGFQFFVDIIQNLNITRKNMNFGKSEIKQEYAMKYSNAVHNRNGLLCSLFPWLESYTNFNQKVDSLSLNSVKRFYKEYYQPQNTALKIVGNVQAPLLLIQNIRDAFGNLKSTHEVGSKINFDSIYFKRPLQFNVLERNHPLGIRENQIAINLFYKDSELSEEHYSEENFWKDQHMMLWEMMIEILEDELKELNQVYNPKFDIALQSFIKYKITPAVFRMEILSDPSEVESSISKVFEKINVLKTSGISKEYFEKLKDRKSKQLDHRKTKALDYWSSEINSHISDGDFFASNKDEMIKQWLDNLSLSEFNKNLENYLSKNSFDIGVQLPNGSERRINKKRILDVIETALSERKTLVNKGIKQPSKLISRDIISSLEMNGYSIIPDSLIQDHYQLNNGLELILVNDTTKSGFIRLQAFSHSGSLNFEKTDFFNASYAPRIVQHSGFGGFNKFQLDNYTNHWGKFNFYAYVNQRESGIKANVEAENIEELFQYLYLFIKEPRFDKNAFIDWQIKVEKSFLNPAYSIPAMDFRNKTKSALSSCPIAFHSGTDYLKHSQNVNFERSISIFKKLFSNSSDFTYILTGDFNKKKILELGLKYLGNLPNSSNNFKRKHENRGLRDAKILKHNISFEKDSNRHNIFFIMQSMSGQEAYSWEENLKAMLLGELLIDEILNLRFEEEFALYHHSAYGSYDEDLGRYVVMATMDCKKEEIDEVKLQTHKIFENFRRGFISESNYEAAVKRLRMKVIENSNNPKNMEMLYNYYSDSKMNFKDFPKEGELLSYLNGLTLEKIKEIAQDFFKEEKTYEFSM